jgi:hypothetical protein
MMFKTSLAVALVAAGLVAAPLAPASANDWHRGHAGVLFGLGALAGAVVVGAATVVAAPFNALAAASTPAPAPAYAPAYAPAPVYAAPVYAPPVYYYPRPVYAYPYYAYPPR